MQWTKCWWVWYSQTNPALELTLKAQRWLKKPAKGRAMNGIFAKRTLTHWSLPIGATLFLVGLWGLAFLLKSTGCFVAALLCTGFALKCVGFWMEDQHKKLAPQKAKIDEEM